MSLKNDISDLDELVSKLKLHAHNVSNLTDIEKETLRHHAKDMIGAGTHYLIKLNQIDDINQMQDEMGKMIKNQK